MSAAPGATLDETLDATLDATFDATFDATLDATLDVHAAGRVCRKQLRDAGDVRSAAVILTRMLPGATWDTVQVALLPSDVPADAYASVEMEPGEDPLVYWRGTLRGSELLHELVHAWHSTLSEEVFSRLLTSLSARDARGGFGADVVEEATTSVVDGIALTVSGRHFGERVRLLAARAATVAATDPGALARRSDAIIAELAGSDWAQARRTLTHGLSSRQANARTPRDWAAWVRVFFLVEAQAYDAQARCGA